MKTITILAAECFHAIAVVAGEEDEGVFGEVVFLDGCSLSESLVIRFLAAAGRRCYYARKGDRTQIRVEKEGKIG